MAGEQAAWRLQRVHLLWGHSVSTCCARSGRSGHTVPPRRQCSHHVPSKSSISQPRREHRSVDLSVPTPLTLFLGKVNVKVQCLKFHPLGGFLSVTLPSGPPPSGVVVLPLSTAGRCLHVVQNQLYTRLGFFLFLYPLVTGSSHEAIGVDEPSR